MAKNHYTPNEQRSISMNPNNPAFYGSRDIPVPPHVAGQEPQPSAADKPDSTGAAPCNPKPRD